MDNNYTRYDQYHPKNTRQVQLLFKKNTLVLFGIDLSCQIAHVLPCYNYFIITALEFSSAPATPATILHSQLCV